MFIRDSYFSSFWFSMDPAQTHFLRFIFEGYGNEFQMTTISKEYAVVRVMAMRGSEPILVKILMELKEKIGLKRVPLEFLEANSFPLYHKAPKGHKKPTLRNKN